MVIIEKIEGVKRGEGSTSVEYDLQKGHMKNRVNILNHQHTEVENHSYRPQVAEVL